MKHTVFVFNGYNIGDLLCVKESSNTGHEILSKGRMASNYVGKTSFLDVLDEKRGVIFRQTLIPVSLT